MADGISDDEHESDDDILPGPSREYFAEEEMSVDDTICTLIASLHLDKSRNKKPTEDDDDMLRIVHERIQLAINKEIDESRRRRMIKVLSHSNCIREQVFYLRRVPQNTQPSQTYIRRLNVALSFIVNNSFEDEYRKVSILLGLVETLAEVLVLEILVFDTVPQKQEHRAIRKLIANALTNLTFGQIQSKRRLCAYPDFLDVVVRIINEARNLAQVYAGLIRNLSWLADSDMSLALSPCVKALARSAIHARQQRDEGCLRASLSALWNLASHSMDNKKTICDEPGFLRLLASVLTPDINQISVVESASGILKYASQYLSSTSSHLEERPLLVNGLLQLLMSSSFTIECNALGAISYLIAKDPHLQMLIRSNNAVMHQLNSLRDSVRDDIRTAVKGVLNCVNQPAGYSMRMTDMSTSVEVGYDSFRDSGRLLPLRSIRPTPPPAVAHPPFPQFNQQPANVQDQRSCSLPRHFIRGGMTGGMHGSTHQSPNPAQFTPNHNAFNVRMHDEEQQKMLHQIQQDEMRHNAILGDQEEVEDEYDNTSAVCDRSNASRQSLEMTDMSANQSGFVSHMDTANNSARLSPVSPSELPDSPTHYTLLKMQEEMQQLNTDPSQPLSINVQQTTLSDKDSTPNKSFNTGPTLSGSDATATQLFDDQQTPTFPSFFSQQNNTTMDNGDTGGYTTLQRNDDLLGRSIESAFPKPKDGPSFMSPPNFTPSRKNQNNSFVKKSQAERDQLLNECILSAMPTSSPGSSKNEQGGRVRSVTPPNPDNNTELVPAPEQSTSTRPVLEAQNSVSSEASDEFYGMEDYDDLDTSLPIDCLEEQMTIDCSSFSNESKKTPRKTRLPMPSRRPVSATRSSATSAPASATKVIRTPAAAAKPQTQSAVITPYNYRQPKDVQNNKTSTTTTSVENNSKSSSSTTIHSNTMLVTTV